MSQAWYWGSIGSSRSHAQNSQISSGSQRGRKCNTDAGSALVAELSSEALSDVFCRLIRIIKEELALTLSHSFDYFEPCRVTPRENYYPAAVEREHQSYFVEDKEKEALEQQRKEHAQMVKRVNFAPEDMVQYPFDRSMPSDSKRKSKLQLKEDAIHYKKKNQRKWLSILSNSEEDLARANFAAKVEKYAKRFAKDAKPDLDWVRHNNTAAVQKRKRLEHLLGIIEQEQQRNIQRELKLCSKQMSEDTTRQQLDAIKQANAKSRANTADWIMRILQEYRLISGKEMADYINCMSASLRVNKGLNTASSKDASSSYKTGGPRSEQPSDRPKTSAVTSQQSHSYGGKRNVNSRLRRHGFDFNTSSEESINLALKRRQAESQQALAQVKSDSMLNTSSLGEMDTNRNKTGRARSSVHVSRSRNQRRRPKTRDSAQIRPNRQTPHKVTTNISEPVQYGGWGARISYAAERISEHEGVNYDVGSKQLSNSLRNDRLSSKHTAYSFLLKRPITRNI